MCKAGQKERSDVCQHRLSGQVLENRLVIIPALCTRITHSSKGQFVPSRSYVLYLPFQRRRLMVPASTINLSQTSRQELTEADVAAIIDVAHPNVLNRCVYKTDRQIPAVNLLSFTMVLGQASQLRKASRTEDGLS